MRQSLMILLSALLMLGCGQSYEEQKQTRRQQLRQHLRSDSAALKVAVVPTIDCLPVLVASERHFFDSLGVDVRIRRFNEQMDGDTAIANRRVEMVVSDLVRMERLAQKGMPVEYLTATNAHWQLFTNRNQRIRELKQLDDKMVAMTRYSATDLLADLAVDSAKLKAERVFKVQFNDVHIRLRMLQNNEMDAMLLPEPQATIARLGKHRMLLDTRRMDLCLGVVAYNPKVMADKTRQKQLKAFEKAYNRACDSINAKGTRHYLSLLRSYYRIEPQQVDSLLDKVRFQHITKPREKDIDRARAWLKKQ